MRLKYLFLLPLLLFILSSCNDSDTDELTVSSSSFSVPANGTSFTFQITASSAWNVSSDAAWCDPNVKSGTGNATLTVSITPNTGQAERTATLMITDQSTSLLIKVTQGTEEHYKLPIIFHVLYNNKDDRIQYVEKGQLSTVVNICNQLYANKFNNGDKEKNSVDINLEFTLATTDPNGKTLQEPGVERIYWPTSTMDCKAFMTEMNATNAALLWDMNQYINVFLYTFSDSQILGISHIPYASSTRPLDGLQKGDNYFAHAKTTYPHGVSINNQYIYEIAEYGYNSAVDVSVTLAHELGHYLGLFHAFGASNEETNKSWKEDTDYCEDTPNYDRAAYEQWVNNYLTNTPTDNIKFSDLIKRTSSTGSTFKAHNIMDYYYCFSDEFTPEQRTRIRHVLSYSPLTPGSKYDKPSARSIADSEIPSIRVIK